MQLSDYQGQVQKRVDDLLQSQIAALKDHAPRLKEAMQYALLMGGKRMRPMVAFMVADTLGIAPEQVDPIACAIECVHAYSLIHDDLPSMDDDALRRGHPTVHIAFDEATAVLAGDALQTLAFEILCNSSAYPDKPALQLHLIKCLASAAGYSGMCGGQAMDLAATNKLVSQEHLQQLHELKTGALLKAAILMPASLVLASQSPQFQQLESFADAVGLAFQVQDDILDVTSDSQTLGKPQGSDAQHNKSTYPTLMGLQGAQDYLQQLHKQALHALHALPYNTQLLEAFADYNVKRDH